MIKEFIIRLTIFVSDNPMRESFQAQAIGLNYIGHNPILSWCAYSAGLGLNPLFTSRDRSLQDSPFGVHMSTNQ